MSQPLADPEDAHIRGQKLNVDSIFHPRKKPPGDPYCDATLQTMQAKADSCICCHGTRMCMECGGDGADHEDNPEVDPPASGYGLNAEVFKGGKNLTPGLCFLCNGYGDCTACRHNYQHENTHKVTGRD